MSLRGAFNPCDKFKSVNFPATLQATSTKWGKVKYPLKKDDVDLVSNDL